MPGHNRALRNQRDTVDTTIKSALSELPLYGGAIGQGDLDGTLYTRINRSGSLSNELLALGGLQSKPGGLAADHQDCRALEAGARHRLIVVVEQENGHSVVPFETTST